MKSTAAILRRPTLEWFAVTLLCVLLAVLAALEGWLWRIDQTIYDALLSAWRRAPSADVVVVAIDDTSLAGIGRWLCSLVLTVDLPGIPREAVKVEVADRSLTLAVEHATDRGDLRWSRTLQLGGSLDAEGVNARYADGRLTVTVPPAAKPEPRAIAIEGPAITEESADEVPAAIEASAEG